MIERMWCLDKSCAPGDGGVLERICSMVSSVQDGAQETVVFRRLWYPR